MKVDFTKTLSGPDSKPILVPDPDKPESEKPIKLTLRQACTEALCGSYRGDDNMSGDEKYKCYRLATTINRKDQPVDLIASEIVLLKERLAKRWPALVVGPAWDAIEPPAEDEKKLKIVKKKD